MSAQPYHKRYHSDALAGFMSLNLEERGAYQTLLDMIYDRGGAIPGNDRLIAGYLGCSLRKWASLRQALLEKGKIYLLEDGSISNARAEKEIENYAKTSRKHAENGLKGARKVNETRKYSNEINETETAKPVEKSGLLPESRSQIDSVPNGTGDEPPDVVKTIFDLGVSILVAGGKAPGEARSLIGKWRKTYSDALVLEALLSCQAKRISEPVEWMTKALAGMRGAPPSQGEFLNHVAAKYTRAA